MTIRRMSIACWMTKATDTHSELVKLIAFPQQQWLYEGASTLRYTYIDCFFYKQKHGLHLLKFLSIITMRSLTICFTGVYPYLHHKSLFLYL
jgi:hypothetical protein